MYEVTAKYIDDGSWWFVGLRENAAKAWELLVMLRRERLTTQIKVVRTDYR